MQLRIDHLQPLVRFTGAMPTRRSGTVTLAEASRLVGRAQNTVRKRVLDGELQATRLGSGEWAITVGDLAVVWPEDTWPQHSSQDDAPLAEWVERVLAAEQRAVEAITRHEGVVRELEQQRRQALQLRSDLEEERSRSQRLEADAGRLGAELVGAAARAEELDRVAGHERERAERLGVEVDELRSRAAVAEARTDEVRAAWEGDLALLTGRIEELRAAQLDAEVRADEARSQLDAAVLAMGWWSKRRWRRRPLPAPAA